MFHAEILPRMTVVATPSEFALQPRARGVVHVGMKHVQGVTRLKDLRQQGSLKAVFPHGQATPQVVLVNTAGGVTGGDQFATTAILEPAAQLTLTTQAAERIYAAQPGSVGQVTAGLTVTKAARLFWLPQETILFENGALNRRQTFDVDPLGHALIVEPLIFGRPAMGEALTQVSHRDDLRIMQDGRLVFRDAFHLQASDVAGLKSQGFGALAAVHLVGAGAADQLDMIRPLLPETAGASAISDTILTLRFLSFDSFTLRQSLIPVVEALAQTELPKVWRL